MVAKGVLVHKSLQEVLGVHRLIHIWVLVMGEVHVSKSFSA